MIIAPFGVGGKDFWFCKRLIICNMKKFYSFLGALLVATGLFAQTNYTCTFSANVPMDSVQVKNTVSGEAKMLYYPDNEITLQKG